ncbi:hypothetical protein BZA05DRAFT_437233 [Tricharina praecox]|uniref:uncharacterized protein n=1 Tax=Tricharina praecox TaxID=43433 RepID=UPI00221F6253|nr:uncharacterized protein BZA05DRAFT_437233 [Tricharina praecox]KAI5849149.1 hypothetical protein BZA05DRAFT_437233 [Tricharina praecox]
MPRFLSRFLLLSSCPDGVPGCEVRHDKFSSEKLLGGAAATFIDPVGGQMQMHSRVRGEYGTPAVGVGRPYLPVPVNSMYYSYSATVGTVAVPVGRVKGTQE